MVRIFLMKSRHHFFKAALVVGDLVCWWEFESHPHLCKVFFQFIRNNIA